jgi:hypothetical protein
MQQKKEQKEILYYWLKSWQKFKILLIKNYPF